MTLDELIDELRATLTSRVLMLFGVPVTVDVTVANDLASPVGAAVARVVHRDPRELAATVAHGMRLPQVVRSVTVADDGTLVFKLDRPLFTAARMRELGDVDESLQHALDRFALNDSIPDAAWQIVLHGGDFEAIRAALAGE